MVIYDTGRYGKTPGLLSSNEGNVSESLSLKRDDPTNSKTESYNYTEENPKSHASRAQTRHTFLLSLPLTDKPRIRITHTGMRTPPEPPSCDHDPTRACGRCSPHATKYDTPVHPRRCACCDISAGSPPPHVQNKPASYLGKLTHSPYTCGAPRAWRCRCEPLLWPRGASGPPGNERRCGRVQHTRRRSCGTRGPSRSDRESSSAPTVCCSRISTPITGG